MVVGYFETNGWLGGYLMMVMAMMMMTMLFIFWSPWAGVQLKLSV
jgi:hypothetical protein